LSYAIVSSALKGVTIGGYIPLMSIFDAADDDDEDIRDDNDEEYVTDLVQP
jgi:hypothetical protein